jgi:hypothetical protein
MKIIVYVPSVMPNKKHFKIGTIFFLYSFIIGYGGIALTSFLYLWTDNKIWIGFGSGVYGFSWILFGIGFVLSGKEGLKYFRCIKK